MLTAILIERSNSRHPGAIPNPAPGILTCRKDIKVATPLYQRGFPDVHISTGLNTNTCKHDVRLRFPLLCAKMTKEPALAGDWVSARALQDARTWGGYGSTPRSCCLIREILSPEEPFYFLILN